MTSVNTNQLPQAVDTLNPFTLPIAVDVQPDPKLNQLLADLSPDISWGDRKIAAQKLGLLDALRNDPFWMVRCAIIQALEGIGDPRAIPSLREVAKSDGFQAVRSHAAKVIERL